MNDPERFIRTGLPLVRAMQSVMPLPLSGWLIRQGMRRVRLPAGVTRESSSVAGIPCEWLIPGDVKPGRVLLYLHGGGFVYGLTPQHLQLGAWLAKRMRARVLMVDYRLAPEHPYPAALEDCLAVYRWLLKEGYTARNIAIAGDSAGGNLTITTMLKLRQDGLPLPAAAACLSPVTDLSDKGSRRQGVKDPLLPDRAIHLYTESYVGQSDPHDPLISPVYADLRGLPPMLIHVGEQETLREDAVRFTDLAKKAGVHVRLEVYPRMWHVWQIFPQLPQARQSLEDIAQFLMDRW